MDVTIVMPCLDEAETLAVCIEKAQRAISGARVRGEIVVADNGSTDGSREIASALGARVVHVSARGYGNALKAGIASAHSEFVMMGDADDSYDFSHLPRFLERLRDGADLVMGNRFLGGIQQGAMPRLHRYLGNPVLTTIGRVFFHSPIGDFHCGLRAFTKSAYARMNLQAAGMEFASEMVVRATLLGMRVDEVPTTLSPDGRSRPPHLRTWRDGWRHLRFLLLYSPRWLFLYPGALIMLSGVLGMAWLIPGPRTVGRIELDIHSLMTFGMMVLVGFQAIAFAVFAKIFGTSQALLPPDERMDTLYNYVTLEVGLIVGLVFIAAGVAGIGVAVTGWSSVHFGALDPAHTTRILMPALISMALGSEIVMSSFFLSLLGFSKR